MAHITHARCVKERKRDGFRNERLAGKGWPLLDSFDEVVVYVASVCVGVCVEGSSLKGDKLGPIVVETWVTWTHKVPDTDDRNIYTVRQMSKAPFMVPKTNYAQVVTQFSPQPLWLVCDRVFWCPVHGWSSCSLLFPHQLTKNSFSNQLPNVMEIRLGIKVKEHLFYFSPGTKCWELVLFIWSWVYSVFVMENHALARDSCVRRQPFQCSTWLE